MAIAGCIQSVSLCVDLRITFYISFFLSDFWKLLLSYVYEHIKKNCFIIIHNWNQNKKMYLFFIFVL